MKKLMMILMIAIAASSVAFGQTKMSKDSKTEAQIIARAFAVRVSPLRFAVERAGPAD